MLGGHPGHPGTAWVLGCVTAWGIRQGEAELPGLAGIKGEKVSDPNIHPTPPFYTPRGTSNGSIAPWGQGNLGFIPGLIPTLLSFREMLVSRDPQADR